MTARAMLARTAVLGLAAAALAPATASAAAPRTPRAAAQTVFPVRIATVPPLAGVRFSLGGRIFTSGPDGVARTAAARGTYDVRVLDRNVRGHGVRSRFSRWGDDAFTPARQVDVHGPTRLEVGYEQAVHVTFAFVDRHGRPVDLERVTKLTLSSTIGTRESFQPSRGRWLLSGRVTRRFDGLDQTRIQYSVERVFVDGSDVVHRAQQRFLPADVKRIRLRLLLYSARLSAHDLLFGFRVGTKLRLVYPDGHPTTFALDGRPLAVGALPRGTYGIKFDALGYSPGVPLALSKNQVLDLRVVTYLDLLVLALVAAAATFVLVVVRRAHLRRKVIDLIHPWRRGPALALIAAGLGTLLAIVALARATGELPPSAYAKLLGTLVASVCAVALAVVRRPLAERTQAAGQGGLTGGRHADRSQVVPRPSVSPRLAAAASKGGSSSARSPRGTAASKGDTRSARSARGTAASKGNTSSARSARGTAASKGGTSPARWARGTAAHASKRRARPEAAARRPARTPAPFRPAPPSRWWRAGTLFGAAVVAAMLLAEPGAARAPNPIPVLAYYYIWYDSGSWQRAKTTYPLLGRYSSDDVDVMRRHATLARDAGIDGFIVSWKSTPKLNRRLASLIRVADETGLKLELIYEGLDFDRNPLPVARVAQDLDFFAQRFGSDPAFNLEGKPVVIWSGTWRYTRNQVRRVAERVNGRLQLLASEKSPDGYRRLAGLVDGDAYYWSSVDPERTPGYAAKLAAMSVAVHRRNGLWIAPAAAGFDARLVGGTRVIPRAGGRTLRTEWNTALSSSPDLIGLISWNEFSENSEIEPTQAFGSTYLRIVRDIVGGRVAVQGDFDSSDPPPRQFGYAVPLLIGIGALLLTGVGAYMWRREVRRSLGRPA